MADDFDVEALLEEPYRERRGNSSVNENNDNSNKQRSRSRERDRGRYRDDDKRRRSKDRERSRSRHEEKRSKSERHRERSHSRDSRDRRDNDRRRSRDGDDHHRSSRHRSRERGHSSGHSRHRSRQHSISPIRIKEVEPDLTPEERDARTIFCMQLAARIRPRDLEEFFSAVGTVRDVRLILDNKSHRSKGIAYIEFAEVDSVPLALALSGQKLLGVPIMVQPSHAERNRIANAQAAAMKASLTCPMRLYVGSLHYNITEDMLRGIFEPFGRIDDLKIMKDHQTNRSAGYAFITYSVAEDAKRAMDQLNGFELAGRPMKVGHVTDRSGEEGGTSFDVDEVDRLGFGLGATGRLQLMAKLAEGTGMQLPQAAANVLGAPAIVPNPLNYAAVPPIATQCFMLSNMFDPSKETGTGWEDEVKDDVILECNKHGGALHIYIDRASAEGNVYIKCPSIAAAVASVNTLHGRYFGGKIITAAYIPLPNYHELFPDSVRAMQYVMPSSGRTQV